MNNTIIKIFSVYILAGIIATFILYITSPFIDLFTNSKIVQLSLSSILASLISIRYGIRKLNIDILTLLKIKIRIKILKLIILSTTTIISIIFISLPIYNILSIQNTQEDILNLFYYSIIGQISYIFIFPILEEILFRGLLLPLLLKEYSITKSIIIISLLFGLVHSGVGIDSFFNTTIISIVISYLYVSTKSVTPCIITHILNNSFVYLLDYVDQRYITISPTIGWIFIPILLISIYYLRQNIKTASTNTTPY